MLPQRMMMAAGNPANKAPAPAPQPSYPAYLRYGYFGGGNPGPFTPTSRVDRIDYSNDTVTASVRGPLSLIRERLAATGTSSYGYFGGGNPGPFTPTSRVDRIDYSNDTVTASVRGPLSEARYSLGGAQNCPL